MVTLVPIRVLTRCRGAEGFPVFAITVSTLADETSACNAKPISVPGCRPQFGGRGGQPFAAPCTDRHTAALCHKCPGTSESQAPAGARDDGGFVCELEVHVRAATCLRVR